MFGAAGSSIFRKDQAQIRAVRGTTVRNLLHILRKRIPSVNAFFRLNEATGAAEKVFDMTGANIAGVFDLSINE